MTASTKTDNSYLSGKVALRERFMGKYHADGKARVLDCCMGTGEIWKEVRRKYTVASYTGLDILKMKGRLRMDSARYLQGGQWDHDVVDIDTYGSPWAHWEALLATAQRDVTVFLTIGLTIVGGGGMMCKTARRALGIDTLQHVPQSIMAYLAPAATEACLALCLNKFDVAECAKVVQPKGKRNLNAQYMGVRLVYKKTTARLL